MKLSERIKLEVSLLDVANAAGVVWDIKQSSPNRGDWWAPCPFHAEKTASFHLSEKPGARGVFHCHGCNAKGSVIDFVQAWKGCNFREALRFLADLGGLQDEDPAKLAAKAQERARLQWDADRKAEAAAGRKRDRARLIWAASTEGAPELEVYLTGRGIDLGLIGGVPRSLRYHPNLEARDKRGEVIHRGPAMVAFIGRDRFVGVHRTWINGPARACLPDGTKVPKQWLGYTGALWGCPVMLSPRGSAVAVVGEGIETTLAGLAWLRRRGIHASAEAAMSLGAMAGPQLSDGPDIPATCLRSGHPLPSAWTDPTGAPGWLPPDGTERVHILADPSTKSPAAAERHATRAANKIAACGVVARLEVPRGSWDHEHDFADLAALGELNN